MAVKLEFDFYWNLVRTQIGKIRVDALPCYGTLSGDIRRMSRFEYLGYCWMLELTLASLTLVGALHFIPLSYLGMEFMFSG